MPQVTSDATTVGVVAAGVLEAVVSVAGVAEVVGVLASPLEPPPQADSNNADSQTHGKTLALLRNITKHFQKMGWLRINRTKSGKCLRHDTS